MCISYVNHSKILSGSVKPRKRLHLSLDFRPSVRSIRMLSLLAAIKTLVRSPHSPTHTHRFHSRLKWNGTVNICAQCSVKRRHPLIISTNTRYIVYMYRIPSVYWSVGECWHKHNDSKTYQSVGMYKSQLLFSPLFYSLQYWAVVHCPCRVTSLFNSRF